jgi:dCTP deaminase
VDVTLGPVLYELALADGHSFIDPHDQGSVKFIEHKFESFVLEPRKLYLGSVNEAFACHAPAMVFPGDGQEHNARFVSMYDGRSTCARIGLASHVTAGFGDYGFAAPYTLECHVVHDIPFKVYAGMRIGQVFFEQVAEPDHYMGAYTGHGQVLPVLGPGRF